jgi:hypothetical protein
MSEMKLILENWRQHKAEETNKLNEDIFDRRCHLEEKVEPLSEQYYKPTGRAAWEQNRPARADRRRSRAQTRLQRRDPEAYEQQRAERRARIARGTEMSNKRERSAASTPGTTLPAPIAISGQGDLARQRAIAGQGAGSVTVGTGTEKATVEPGAWTGARSIGDADLPQGPTRAETRAANQAERQKKQTGKKEAAAFKKRSDSFMRRHRGPSTTQKGNIRRRDATEEATARAKEDRKAANQEKRDAKDRAEAAAAAAADPGDPTLLQRAKSAMTSGLTGALPLPPAASAATTAATLSPHSDLAAAEIAGTATEQAVGAVAPAQSVTPWGAAAGGFSGVAGNLGTQALQAMSRGGPTRRSRALARAMEPQQESLKAAYNRLKEKDHIEELAVNIKPLVVEILKRMRQPK